MIHKKILRNKLLYCAIFLSTFIIKADAKNINDFKEVLQQIQLAYIDLDCFELEMQNIVRFSETEQEPPQFSKLAHCKDKSFYYTEDVTIFMSNEYHVIVDSSDNEIIIMKQSIQYDSVPLQLLQFDTYFQQISTYNITKHKDGTKIELFLEHMGYDTKLIIKIDENNLFESMKQIMKAEEYLGTYSYTHQKNSYDTITIETYFKNIKLDEKNDAIQYFEKILKGEYPSGFNVFNTINY